MSNSENSLSNQFIVLPSQVSNGLGVKLTSGVQSGSCLFPRNIASGRLACSVGNTACSFQIMFVPKLQLHVSSSFWAFIFRKSMPRRRGWCHYRTTDMSTLSLLMAHLLCLTGSSARAKMEISSFPIFTAHLFSVLSAKINSTEGRSFTRKGASILKLEISSFARTLYFFLHQTNQVLQQLTQGVPLF